MSIESGAQENLGGLPKPELQGIDGFRKEFDEAYVVRNIQACYPEFQFKGITPDSPENGNLRTFEFVRLADNVKMTLKIQHP